MNADWAREARAFHREIEEAQKRNAQQSAYREDGYKLVPVVGIEQPTLQSASVEQVPRSTLMRQLQRQGHGRRWHRAAGLGATPLELEKRSVRSIAAEMHGSLQNADGALANVKWLADEALDIDLSRFRAELPPPAHARCRRRGGGRGAADRASPREQMANPPVTARAHALAGETTEPPSARGAGQERRARTGSEGELDLRAGTWRVRIEARRSIAPVTDLVVVAAA